MVEFWTVLGAALRLDAGLFRRIEEPDAALIWSAAGIAVLAAASTMLGHIAVLLLNRVAGWRLATSLLLSAVSLGALQVVQVGVTWMTASLTLQRPMPLLPLLIVGLVSTAPLSLSFVTAMPHLGLGFGRILQAWSYLIIVVAFSYAFSLGLISSLLFTLAGWLVMQVLSRILHRPMEWLASWLWSLATGRPTMVTARDVLAGMPIIPISHPNQQEILR